MTHVGLHAPAFAHTYPWPEGGEITSEGTGKGVAHDEITPPLQRPEPAEGVKKPMKNVHELRKRSICCQASVGVMRLMQMGVPSMA